MGQIGGCAWCGSSACAGVPSALQALCTARALHADLLRCLIVFFLRLQGGRTPHRLATHNSACLVVRCAAGCMHVHHWCLLCLMTWGLEAAGRVRSILNAVAAQAV
jgi:hypothetical protein